MSQDQIFDLTEQLLEANNYKNQAYSERNKLIALVSKLFPASLEKHEGEAEEGWSWVVFIQLPTGQASWHIHDSELNLFQHLEPTKGRGTFKWDGHTTEEKYELIDRVDNSRLFMVRFGE